MAVNQPQTSVRTQLLLEGGGRLEGIAEIADIRLEKDQVKWTRTAQDCVEVTGAINAYIYTLLPRNNEVRGQGVQIPFTRQVSGEQLRTDELTVELEDLASEHEFDPITGDFQHRVTAVIVISPTQPLKGTLQSRGETVLSQIAVGERPPRDDDHAPASTRPPSPEEFESMRQEIESNSAKEEPATDRGVPEEDEAQPDEAQPHEAQPDEAQPDEAQPHEAQPDEAQPDEEQSGEEQSDEEQEEKPRDGGPLEWKPFPPPLN